MTTIYKTTERGGKRPLLTLSQGAEGALNTIKRVVDYMGWEHSVNGQEIAVKFHKGDQTATYSVEEKIAIFEGAGQ